MCAVDSVVVSGIFTLQAIAAVNQAWNWSMGDGRRSLRESVPMANCLARELSQSCAGATVGGVQSLYLMMHNTQGESIHMSLTGSFAVAMMAGQGIKQNLL